MPNYMLVGSEPSAAARRVAPVALQSCAVLKSLDALVVAVGFFAEPMDHAAKRGIEKARGQGDKTRDQGFHAPSFWPPGKRLGNLRRILPVRRPCCQATTRLIRFCRVWGHSLN